MIELHLLWPPGTTEPSAPFTDDRTLEDLGFPMIIDAMAAGDADIARVAKAVFIHATTDTSIIRWRQELITDAIAHPQLVRDLARIAQHGAQMERRTAYATRPQAPISQLLRSREILALLIADLRALAQRIEEPDGDVSSHGLRLLFTTIRDNFDSAYINSLEIELERLKFTHGLVTRATLGPGNLTNPDLIIEAPFEGRGWRDRLALSLTSKHRIEIAPRDQAGSETLRELRNLALGQIGVALAHGLDTIVRFFVALRDDLAWLVGSLNLRDYLSAIGVPICFPEPTDQRWELSFCQLIEPTLALRSGQRPTPNDFPDEIAEPIVISGANSGGKTTWLQGTAIAIVMMQAGSFVTAEQFRASMRSGLRTFFPEDEDRELRQGRLQSELARLATTIASLSAGGLLLMNEPLASTNEMEASAIVTTIVAELTTRGITTIVVTHYPSVARELGTYGVSLRPEVINNGVRTHRIQASPAPENSSAMDIYRQLGGW